MHVTPIIQDSVKLRRIMTATRLSVLVTRSISFYGANFEQFVQFHARRNHQSHQESIKSQENIVHLLSSSGHISSHNFENDSKKRNHRLIKSKHTKPSAKSR